MSVTVVCFFSLILFFCNTVAKKKPITKKTNMMERMINIGM